MNYLQAIKPRTSIFLHPQKSTPALIDSYMEKLRGIGGKAFLNNTHKFTSDKLQEMFGFEIVDEGRHSNGFYKIVRSERYPDVTMVGFTDEFRSSQNEREGRRPIDAHRVVFIKRPEGLEYYNPNGEAYYLFPISLAMKLEEHGLDMSLLRPNEEYTKPSVITVDGEEELDLRAFMKLKRLTPAVSMISDHQGEFPVCVDCSVMRAIHNESNEDYHTAVTNQAVAPVKRIVSAAKNTADMGVIEKDHLAKAESMKNGGIVKGKKGQPVPIIAHAGELVVPQKIAKKVAKSLYK